MYVRIARFEGGDPAGADAAIDRVREMSGGERPPGLEGARRLLMLVDRENGRGLGLTFFDSDEDMRRGDEALNTMDPGGDQRRTSVEMYEVGLEREF